MLLKNSALAAVLCIVSITPAALAQQSAPPPPTTEAPPAPAVPTSAPPVPAEARPSLQEEVVVTGSRIRRKDLTTPAPVTVVTRQQLENSGRMTIGDFLQTMPEQGNAPNFQVNTAGINYGTDSSTRINLRSLGVQRTLVLLNGRRMVASGLGASAAPDLNTIPAEAVERVEILKDGASAIYGSDAIAGVVNVITRRNYNGLDAGAMYGVSQRGDAGTFDAHITAGTSDETKSALFSVRYFKQYDSWLRDRDWSKQALDYDFTSGGGGQYDSGSSRVPEGALRIPEDPNNPGHPLCNGNPFCLALTDNGANWGVNKRYIRDPITNLACGPNAAGQIQCYRNFGVVAPANGNTGTDFYNYNEANYLTTPSQTVQAYSSGDLKWSNVRGYYEASFTQRTGTQNAAPMPLNPSDYADISISKNNIYNPFGTDIVYLGRRLVEFGDRGYSEDLGTFHVVTGVEGTAPPSFGPLQGWYWDASLNYGRTSGTFTTSGSFRNSRVRDAVGPSMMINGKPACVTVAGDPATVIPNCVPLNLFGGPNNGSIDSSQTAYLSYTGTSRAFDELFTLGASVGGDLVKIAAERPVSLALGYEFRRQSGAQIADPVAAERDSADFDFASTNGYFYANEAYAELVAPILANIKGVEDLEAQAALRYANYNTFGGKTTYKLGLRYTPIRDVTLRGTYSTGFRAPNISELYLGGFEFDPAAIDPCSDFTGLDPAVVARCKAGGVKGTGSGDNNGQEIDRNAGNTKLQPETSKNLTVGVVIQPSIARGLSVTVDYYNIKIENAIAITGAPYIIQGCYLGGLQQFCDLIVRNKFGLISYVNDPFTNFGDRSTAGIDFAIRYSLPTPVGRFGAGFEGNYLAFFDSNVNQGGFATVHGAGNFDLGAMPKFKSNLGLEWSDGGAMAGALGRYVASFDECSNTSDQTTAFGGLCNLPDGTTNPFRRRVKSYVQVDVHAAYTLASSIGKTTFAAGINNLFDQAPPYVYSAPFASADPQTYDFLGRYVYGRVQHRF